MPSWEEVGDVWTVSVGLGIGERFNTPIVGKWGTVDAFPPKVNLGNIYTRVHWM